MTEIEQIEDLINQALAVINNAKAEDRPLTEEETASVEQNYSKADGLKKRVALGNKFSRFDKSELADAADKAVKAVVENKPVKDKMNDTVDSKPNTLKGLRSFAKASSATKGEKVLKEFAITTGTNGGALIPTRIAEPLIVRTPSNAIRKALAALGIATDVSSSTENVKLPFFDDSANVATVRVDGTGAGQQGECNPCRELLPAITSVDVPLKEYGSEPVFYSKRFVYAQDWNVDQKTIPMLLSRIERKEEVDWVTALKAGLVSGQTLVTASPTTFTGDEVIDLDEGLSASYEGVPTFYIISKAFKKAVRKMKDGSGQYILAYEEGLGQTLFGQPVFVSAALDNTAANGVVALKIAAEGVVVRDNSNSEVVKYEGESAHPNQVGFEAFSYSGFGFAGAAVAALKMHA